MTQNNNGASVELLGGEVFSGHSLHVSHWSKLPQIFRNLDIIAARMRFHWFLSNYIWECGDKRENTERTSSEYF